MEKTTQRPPSAQVTDPEDHKKPCDFGTGKSASGGNGRISDRLELENRLLEAHGLTRAQVPDGFLRVAVVRVQEGGLALDAPELEQFFRPFRHGVRRASVRAERGRAPEGIGLEERRRRVAVRALCRYLRLLCAPQGPRPQRSRIDEQSSLRRIPLHPGSNERHPRAGDIIMVQPPAAEVRLVDQELRVAIGEGVPEERRRPLPDDLGKSPSTRRRMRRKQQARQARARQLGRPTSERSQDPGGMRPLPLHEGRKVGRMLRDPREKLRFMRSLPPPLRHQLERAARHRPQSRPREAYADSTLHVVAWFAFLTLCSDTPRSPRQGYSRAVEGFCREALAAAFPVNPNTGEPFDPNTLSNWSRVLEQFGLVLREQPNHGKDVYRGPSGWALNVYRMPNAEQLAELLTLVAASTSSIAGSSPEPRSLEPPS